MGFGLLTSPILQAWTLRHSFCKLTATKAASASNPGNCTLPAGCYPIPGSLSGIQCSLSGGKSPQAVTLERALKSIIFPEAVFMQLDQEIGELHIFPWSSRRLSFQPCGAWLQDRADLEDPGREHTIKQLKSLICQTVAYVKSELKRYVDTAHDSDRLYAQVCEAGVFRVVPSVVVLFKALRSDGTTRYPCQNGKAIIKLAEVPAAIVHMNDLVGNQFPYADFAAGAALDSGWKTNSWALFRFQNMQHNLDTSWMNFCVPLNMSALG